MRTKKSLVMRPVSSCCGIAIICVFISSAFIAGCSGQKVDCTAVNYPEVCRQVATQAKTRVIITLFKKSDDALEKVRGLTIVSRLESVPVVIALIDHPGFANLQSISGIESVNLDQQYSLQSAEPEREKGSQP